MPFAERPRRMHRVGGKAESRTPRAPPARRRDALCRARLSRACSVEICCQTKSPGSFCLRGSVSNSRYSDWLRVPRRSGRANDDGVRRQQGAAARKPAHEAHGRRAPAAAVFAALPVVLFRPLRHRGPWSFLKCRAQRGAAEGAKHTFGPIPVKKNFRYVAGRQKSSSRATCPTPVQRRPPPN